MKIYSIQILLGFLSLVVSSESEVTYYVKPSESTQCPGQPCETLNYYLKNVDTTINKEKNLTMIFLNGNHLVHFHILTATPTPVIQTPVIALLGEKKNVTASISGHNKSVCVSQTCSIKFRINSTVYFKDLVLNAFDITLTSKSHVISTVYMSYVKVFDSDLDISAKVAINNSEFKNVDMCTNMHPIMLKESKLYKTLVDNFATLNIHSSIFVNSPLVLEKNMEAIVSGITVFAGTENRSAIATYLGGSLTLSGNVLFANNSANRGGALALYMSTVKIAPKTTVTFFNNSAFHKGGAIYVEPGISPNMVLNLEHRQYSPIFDVLRLLPNFFDLIGCSANINNIYSFNFMDNHASNGGSDVYGAILANASSFYSCNFTVNVTNPSNSSVSSDALRVCMCDEDGQPQCTNHSYIDMTSDIHPGETFKVSVVLVGGDLGLTTGTIYADIIDYENSITPYLALPSEFSDSVTVNNVEPKCRDIEYQLYTHNNSFVKISFAAVQIDNPINHFQMLCKGSKFKIDCYRTSIVTTMFNILHCPPGFTLTRVFNLTYSMCDCYKTLTRDLKMTCLIISGEGLFSWTGNPWVNISSSKNTVYTKNCPHNFCKTFNGSERINLRKNSTYQCEDNRTGTLCGECKKGYSLAIGSSCCIDCTNNNNLALLIFFVAAGFLIVILVSLLNLTVTTGMINGLIFYANIIWTYKDIFFTSERRTSSVLIFLKTFIAWINLDFGIETCFVKGLTAFWKTWLQFVFPFYIWIIAGVIILASKNSFRLTRLLGNRALPLLATLFLLSYMKLLRTVVATLEFSLINTIPFEDPTKPFSEVVWSVDGSLYYFSFPHILLFIAGLFTLLFLWLPYTLLLFLMQWLRRLPNAGIMKWIMRLHPLYDSYFAPLKPKHQYWFGVLLLLRGFLLIMFASTFAIPQNVNLFLLLIFATLLTVYMACIHPYKSRANFLLNLSNLLNLSLLAGTFIFSYTHSNRATLQSVAIGVSTGVSFLQFCCVILIAIFTALFFKSQQKPGNANLNGRQGQQRELPVNEYSGYHDSIFNESDPLIRTY